MFLCRAMNTAGVGTLQETVLRRLWLLWMEPSIVSDAIITDAHIIMTCIFYKKE